MTDNSIEAIVARARKAQAIYEANGSQARYSRAAQAVAWAIGNNCGLADVELQQLRQFNQAIGEDVYDVLTLAGSVNARDHFGGTAPTQVRSAVGRARDRLAAVRH